MQRKRKAILSGLGVLALAALALQCDPNIADAAVTQSTVSASVPLAPGYYYGCEVVNKNFSATIPLLDLHGAYTGTQKCGAGHQLVKVWLGTLPTAGGPAGPQGPKGDTGPAGPQGPKGDPGTDGTDAVTTYTATTAVSARADSGDHGDWATDSFVRTASLTDEGAVSAAHCGASATQCDFFKGSIVDSGSFVTIAGANSPHAGTAVNGTLGGSFSGGDGFEFYADSTGIDASLVPATLSGNGESTSDWFHQFFHGSPVFAKETQLKWSWTYTATGTCEVWTDASTGETGDIVGVNACG